MTTEQAGLLRKAWSSLDAARLLSEQGHHDFSASRAYYAMFYAAEALLLSRELRFSKHSAVHAAFGQQFVKPGSVPAELHRNLLEAARIRNLGDYGIGPEVDASTAGEQILQAEEFIRVAEQRIDALPSGQG